GATGSLLARDEGYLPHYTAKRKVIVVVVLDVEKQVGECPPGEGAPVSTLPSDQLRHGLDRSSFDRNARLVEHTRTVVDGPYPLRDRVYRRHDDRLVGGGGRWAAVPRAQA